MVCDHRSLVGVIDVAGTNTPPNAVEPYGPNGRIMGARPASYDPRRPSWRGSSQDYDSTTTFERQRLRSGSSAAVRRFQAVLVTMG